MNWYRINFGRLVALLLAILLRKPLILALHRSMVAPLSVISNNFTDIRRDIDYKINHNSQVCYLQAVLNDTFDPERRIYIEDAPIIEWDRFLWDEASDRPIMLGVFILQSEKFIGSDSIDFIVFVPTALRLNDNDFIKMNALLRYYKLAGKRYQIQLFN